jgi:lipopolysaccharide biosynthesis protein
MKKILVHVHIFYPEMWLELQSCVENISPNPYDLYVTLVTPNADLEAAILAFNPQAKIQVIENRGFDVGAFAHVVNQVNLAAYDYVVKLHSKRNVLAGSRLNKRYNVSGSIWRDYLLGFVKTHRHFEQSLEAFEADPALGMCAHHCTIRNKKWGKDDIYAFEESAKLLNAVGLQAKSPYVYVGGTMFMVRAALLIPLQKMSLTLDLFEKPDRLIVTSRAHVVERLLGLLVQAQGFVIRDGFHSHQEIKKIERRATLSQIREFFYAVRETRSGKRIVKVFNVPVFVTRYR